MAKIYLARAGGIGAFERYVVLKTISPDRANDQRFVTMFLDEARLSATLNHQNIAQVYEVDEADGNLFITMEYVHGENLRHILENTLRKGWTIPIELAVMIVASAAAGLHHAHERKGKNGSPLNIVHRDVSPANIMVGYDGSVKLLDFGIAKAEERSTKTQQGTIKGKYGYMSPEQCRGKPIDRRSDIFALGIVLYEITTLRRAFRGNDDFDTMKRIVNGDLVPPSVAVPGYPRELEAIVLTAMARDPDFRFQTTQEMLEALDAFMVRAKLSGSPSAMARFMTQLFGTKREPWVEAGGDRARTSEAPGGEHTDVTGSETDDDGVATAVVDVRPDTLDTASSSSARLDAAQTQPTQTRQLNDTLKPDAVRWVPPRPVAPADESRPDVSAWQPDSREQVTRRGGPMPRAGDSRPPGRTPPPELTSPPAATPAPAPLRPSGPIVSPAPVSAPRLSAERPAPAPASPADAPTSLDPIPELRPNRTAMWIIIAVLFGVVAVVTGTIVLGIMSDDPKPSVPAPAPLDPGSGGAAGSAPDPTPAPAADPAPVAGSGSN
jgi:serine/threonine-protein kinase